MRVDILTVFPEMIEGAAQHSILQRAQDKGELTLGVCNIRDFAHDKHRSTDDTPYGGGAGMVMKPEPVFEAVESVLGAPPCCPVILMTPQGRTFNMRVAQELAQYPRLALLCGRYEGVDERIRDYLVTDQISIGDYVLTGGELPALAVMDSISRLIPGVLGDPTGAQDDSHASGLLEYPHYTRPPVFRGWGVPEVLLSGNHAEIARWRKQQSLSRTLKQRPDLIETAPLSNEDRRLLQQIAAEKEKQRQDTKDKPPTSP